MKKIVALVLSLVMVLGLATVAFAADTTYEGLYFKKTDGTEMGAMDLVVYDEVAPKYTDKGVLSLNGTMAYAATAAGNYVLVSSLAEADYVAYLDAQYKVVKFYLAEITNSQYFDGAVFTNFGKACGQIDLGTAFDKDATYYTVKGNATDLFVSAKNGSYNLKVDGKFVTVNPVVAAKNTHKAAFEMVKGEYSKIYCTVCNAAAVKAPNAMSMPENADTTGLPANWFWGTTAAAAGDKVESAQTFDAGIAMYVGMSVMAAAGSAVVLKKKD